jgi:arylformamidase
VLYRGMDRVQLDAAYNNQAAVASFPSLSKQRREQSARVRQARKCYADLRYGEGERERLDFFPADRPGAPVLVFVHGGYWQGGDKDACSFVVEGPASAGFAVAVLEYPIAPEANMQTMVASMDRALTWLTHHVRDLGGDPHRLHLCGHSAGAQLVAMMLASHPPASALLISGIYELEPIRLCYLNEKLGLNAKDAEQFSPLRHLPAHCPPVVVAVGARELPELQRQSASYGAALREHDAPVQELPLAGHDHFSVLEELARHEGKLCQALCGLSTHQAAR